MALPLKNRTSRSVTIPGKKRRSNIPATIKELFQELTTFKFNPKIGLTYKAVFYPDSKFHSESDFKPFLSAVLEKLKEDPKLHVFEKFIQYFAVQIKIISFHHQEGNKSIKVASFCTTIPAIFAQQVDLKQQYDSIMRSTANEFDFTLVSNENHDQQHLYVLCLDFPEFINPEDFENPSSELLQPYGTVIYQYTKPPKETISSNLAMPHYVILQACNNCLPPISKKHFIKEVQKVLTIYTHVVSCNNKSRTNAKSHNIEL